MKYKLINHRIEKDRLILTIERSCLFGLYKTIFECIDSDRYYVRFNMDVWYIYPSFKKVYPTTKLIDFLIESKRLVEFIEC